MRSLRYSLFFVIVLSSVSLFITACGGLAAGASDAGKDAPGQAISDYDSLIKRLEETGAAVEATEEIISQPFFAVPAQLVRFNGADLQIFEYESVAAAGADAAQVAPGGSSIGTSTASWMATPHFFQADRFIVIYIGDDGETLDLLEGVLGAPFAGGSAS